MSPSSARLRWFWRVYAALTILVIVGFAAVATGAAPAIEQRFFPVRTRSTISAVTRTADRLCWTWSGDKLRAAPFTSIDVYLDHQNGDVSFPEVFNRETKQPWHKGGTLPVGPSSIAFCIQLPPNADPAERLVLRQVLHYRGWLGLWDLPVAIPDVVSEGTVPP